MTLGTGTATLVNGAATVNLAGIPATAIVLLTRVNALGTIGDLRRGVITAGVSFEIQSLNILDNSTVNWIAVV